MSAGIVQRRLSNGIKINYWYSDSEPQSCLLRVCGAGGRALEDPPPGPSGGGAAAVAFRSISESGTVGHWQREQVSVRGRIAITGRGKSAVPGGGGWMM